MIYLVYSIVGIIMTLFALARFFDDHDPTWLILIWIVMFMPTVLEDKKNG